jgi:hypothetical protein
MKSIVNLDSPMVSPPPDYPGEFFKGNLKIIVTWKKDIWLVYYICFACMKAWLLSLVSNWA